MKATGTVLAVGREPRNGGLGAEPRGAGPEGEGAAQGHGDGEDLYERRPREAVSVSLADGRAAGNAGEAERPARRTYQPAPVPSGGTAEGGAWSAGTAPRGGVSPRRTTPGAKATGAAEPRRSASTVDKTQQGIAALEARIVAAPARPRPEPARPVRPQPPPEARRRTPEVHRGAGEGRSLPRRSPAGGPRTWPTRPAGRACRPPGFSSPRRPVGLSSLRGRHPHRRRQGIAADDAPQDAGVALLERRGGRRRLRRPAPAPGSEIPRRPDGPASPGREAASTSFTPRSRPIPQTPVLVMTAFGTIEEAVKAMKDGATDFLTKPVDTDHLLLLLDRAVERRRLHTDYVLLKEEYQRRFGLPRVIGEDPSLARDDARRSEGGRERRHGADPGRERHGQGADGPIAPPALGARQGAVRRHQLRGDSRGPPRERAVRPREGGVHGRHGPQGREGRDGPPRNPLPRRDRRPSAGPPGQDPAPRSRETVRARRRRPDHRRRRPGRGRHEPRPQGGGRAEGVPRGSLLPPFGLSCRDSAAAPAPGRRAAPRPGLPRSLRGRDGTKGPAPVRGARSALFSTTAGPATSASSRTASSGR